LNICIDTSALAKCYVREPRSMDLLDWLDGQDGIGTSPLTAVELRCLLTRRRRAGQIDASLESTAMARFDSDVLDHIWRIYPEAVNLFSQARNLIDLVPAVPLRALDALHLAYARHYGAELFVTADKNQTQAAEALGMTVLTFFESTLK
jgi:predicted nucleic acid-binding protein